MFLTVVYLNTAYDVSTTRLANLFTATQEGNLVQVESSCLYIPQMYMLPFRSLLPKSRTAVAVFFSLIVLPSCHTLTPAPCVADPPLAVPLETLRGTSMRTAPRHCLRRHPCMASRGSDPENNK